MYTGGGTISGTLPSMMASSTGMKGSQQCPPTMMQYAPACATDIYAARRNLNSDGSKRVLAALASTYDQTLICLTSSVNTVTWDVSTTSFPVYNKDHALNDDTDFDSSSFESLKQKLINSGVSLSTFTYSFSSISNQIALAFNDYTYDSKLTVIALNRDSCPNGNVMPLNEQTLASVGINSASFLELDPMEDWLIVIPLCFFLVAFGLIGGAKKLIVMKEQRRLKELAKQKTFIREDGSVDRIQYLKDMYNIIKRYLGDLGEEDPIKNLLENDSTEVEKRQQSEEADAIEALLREFFDDLRFEDGEQVEEKVLAESTDPSDDKPSGTEEEEEEGDFEEEFFDEAEGEGDSQEGSLNLDELLMGKDDKIEEQTEDDDEDDKDYNAILSIKKENDRKRKEYDEHLKKLGLSEEERRALLEKYEDSLRRAREMMEGDAEAQEKKRLARLEARKNRKQEGKLKMKELEEKEREINKKYKEKAHDLEGAIEERVASIQDELQKEEDEERKKLDRKLKDRMKKFKDQFHEKIKGKSGNNQKRLIAEHERENERLQNDIERERAYQEKKLLKQREARRKRLVDDATKDLNDEKNDVLREQADELEDMERQKLLLAAEYGLEDDIYGKGPTRDEKTEEEERKLNHIKEIELMRLKQKQKFEKDFDAEYEDNVMEEEEDMDNIQDNIDQERADFQKRINACASEIDKKRLMKELEEKEQEWAEDVEKQRQLQEQRLFEKKKRRQLYRERNNFKLDSKHRAENLDKELELMEFEAYKRESEGFEKVSNMIEEKKGEKDLPLMVYKQLEDLVSRRLDDQEKIQFYELSGKLANLYTDIAFEKALARKNLEEDMNDKVKELDARNVPSQQFQTEINKFQKELERKGKEQEQELIRKQMENEMELREKLKEKHYDSKKALEEDLYKKKQDIFELLGRDFRNEGILKLLMERSREDLDEKLLKIAEDKENDIQKIKLQLVAKNKKDLAQMEKRLEEDLAKEKRNEEIQFDKKKKKVLKDLKEKYMNDLKNRENLTKDQKEKLLKKHEEEINRFEVALAKEKERQFRRMREKLILKRLEAEKEKEHKKREARIKRQIREDDEDSDEEGRRNRKRKGKGKNASLIRQLTDVMSERMESEYEGSSLIPRKHKMNLNVMLRGFKDNIVARQEKEGKFDPNLYLRYRGEDEDDNIQFKRLQTEDVTTLKSEGTQYHHGEAETTRLLRRIIRVEKISGTISESKVQQIIDDLSKLSSMLKK